MIIHRMYYVVCIFMHSCYSTYSRYNICKQPKQTIHSNKRKLISLHTIHTFHTNKHTCIHTLMHACSHGCRCSCRHVGMHECIPPCPHAVLPAGTPRINRSTFCRPRGCVRCSWLWARKLRTPPAGSTRWQPFAGTFDRQVLWR